jgi:hypothetical protein
MCYKALKQVLFRQQPQQRRKLVVVEPKPLWYHHDDIPLTEFQFVKVINSPSLLARFLSFSLHSSKHEITSIGGFAQATDLSKFSLVFWVQPTEY